MRPRAPGMLSPVHVVRVLAKRRSPWGHSSGAAWGERSARGVGVLQGDTVTPHFGGHCWFWPGCVPFPALGCPSEHPVRPHSRGRDTGHVPTLPVCGETSGSASGHGCCDTILSPPRCRAALPLPEQPLRGRAAAARPPTPDAPASAALGWPQWPQRCPQPLGGCTGPPTAPLPGPGCPGAVVRLEEMGERNLLNTFCLPLLHCLSRESWMQLVMASAQLRQAAWICW